MPRLSTSLMARFCFYPDKKASEICCQTVLFRCGTRVVYSTNELLSATNKDVVPALQKSNVIHQFSCPCHSWYVGRTSQRLQDRTKQHVPKSVRSCSSSQKRLLPARRCKSSTQTNTQSLASDSAIGFHLLQNPTGTQHYDDSRFSILVQGRSLFHLQYLLLKPLLSKLLTPPSADKKNSCTA